MSEPAKAFTGFDLKPYPDEVLREHIHHCAKLGLADVEEMPEHAGLALLVGAGPSVRGQLDRIRTLRKRDDVVIIAIKGAHRFLLERGITPDLAICADPKPQIVEQCYPELGEDTIYLLANQCHPYLFQHLRDHKVMVFYPDTNLNKRELEDEPSWVKGGSTTGLRAIHLTWLLGYRDIHLFGFDCCHQEKLRKITGETSDTWKPVEVKVDGISFHTDEHMAQQAVEFPAVVAMCPGLNIKSYGRGIITQILK